MLTVKVGVIIFTAMADVCMRGLPSTVPTSCHVYCKQCMTDFVTLYEEKHPFSVSHFWHVVAHTKYHIVYLMMM